MAEQEIMLHERVARIEQRLVTIDKRADQIDSVVRKLDRLENDLERYRGAVGAVLLVATAVTTFFKLFWHDIKKWLTV